MSTKILHMNIHSSLFIIRIISYPWKQPRCPFTRDWIIKLWDIDTTEHYSARKNKLLINVATWITFKTMLNLRRRKSAYSLSFWVFPNPTSIACTYFFLWGFLGLVVTCDFVDHCHLLDTFSPWICDSTVNVEIYCLHSDQWSTVSMRWAPECAGHLDPLSLYYEHFSKLSDIVVWKDVCIIFPRFVLALEEILTMLDLKEDICICKTNYLF